MEGAILQCGADGDAAEQVGALLDPVEKRQRAVAGQPVFGQVLQFQPGGVEHFPHLGGHIATHRARVFTGGLGARHD